MDGLSDFAKKTLILAAERGETAGLVPLEIPSELYDEEKTPAGTVTGWKLNAAGKKAQRSAVLEKIAALRASIGEK